jgi:hypothetical protein
MNYKPIFSRLFRQWKKHDLAKYRPEFYADLREEFELDVWVEIEIRYLFLYESFIKVTADYGSSGLWVLPFPGSVSLGGCISPEETGLSPEARDKLAEWHKVFDEHDDPWPEEDPFDYATFDIKGLEVAKLLKTELGESVYVEYNSFREIKNVDGKAEEMDFPDFIKEMGMGQSFKSEK